MARSILGTVGLAATLAFAIPVAYVGVDFLLQGRTNLGLLFLGLAVLMVAIEEYLTTPMDVPGMVAGKVLGSAVKEPDETGSGGTDASETADDAGDVDATDDADATTEDEFHVPDAESGKE